MLKFQLKKFTTALLKENGYGEEDERRLKRRRGGARDTKARHLVEFDKDGVILRDETNFLQDRPNYPIYSIDEDN